MSMSRPYCVDDVAAVVETTIEAVVDHCLDVHGAVLDSIGVDVQGGAVHPSYHANNNAVLLQCCRWPSSIYNYDSDTIIHTSIKSLDLKDGRWIECQCKFNKHLVMRRPFEHGNFTMHLQTHPLAPSSQMSIRSFLQPCPSNPCPLNVEPFKQHAMVIQQQIGRAHV